MWCPAVPVENAAVKRRCLLETFEPKRNQRGGRAAVRQRDVQPSNVRLSANRRAGLEAAEEGNRPMGWWDRAAVHRVSWSCVSPSPFCLSCLLISCTAATRPSTFPAGRCQHAGVAHNLWERWLGRVRGRSTQCTGSARVSDSLTTRRCCEGSGGVRRSVASSSSTRGLPEAAMLEQTSGGEFDSIGLEEENKKKKAVFVLLSAHCLYYTRSHLAVCCWQRQTISKNH